VAEVAEPDELAVPPQRVQLEAPVAQLELQVFRPPAAQQPDGVLKRVEPVQRQEPGVEQARRALALA